LDENRIEHADSGIIERCAAGLESALEGAVPIGAKANTGAVDSRFMACRKSRLSES
jgi:hypothetical protein